MGSIVYKSKKYPDLVDPSTTFGASAQHAFSTEPTTDDPYAYQVGFGNRFSSEAIPGTLPRSCNVPQKVKYNLYSEQLNGSTFVSSRINLQNAWFYRIFPSVAHGNLAKVPHNADIESKFLSLNENVEFVPGALCWRAFPIPSVDGPTVDFVQGLKTIVGHGDPTTKEGLAVHVYSSNASMKNRAFCSNDGDMLLVPQLGRLDIQTEFGRMMVRPGELAVIQSGIRFKVELPDGPSRGYIQELFGSRYELPELGPLGSNGMALPRDFESPVASFDMDISEWEIVYKLAGKLWSCRQDHTPFDVVAWDGNYVPFKYAAEKFVNAAFVDKDQADPSLYTVLTAKSKIPGVPITDFMFFTPKWSSATNTFRPPYYHRNMATEVVGIIHGDYKGTSRNLEAGGLSFQSSYMPHGETHEAFEQATAIELKPQRVGEGFLAFMFQISTHCAVTQFALERSGVLEVPPASLWDSMQGHFFEYIDEVNEDLTRRGLPPLGSSTSS
ncbi:homogentisate 1,2-dioxygenase [Colletotrichum truncatum]|uniref:Homogentisate 1,2-dioxygenase n=1 Tax=Colletotrichum truncatum TaxID=5467 RepID=A0ACC3ZKC2_COLTU|nr:homogentisate 1,2-dioxygenase [Colletotrichum truncatum]KAF6799760.1 homogentisate 1,2-dioxygenase [Colletotrichum truncatum]